MLRREDMAIILANTLITIFISLFIIQFFKNDVMNFGTLQDLSIKCIGFAGIIYALVSFKNKKDIK